MIKVRRATNNDVVEMTQLGETFWTQTAYYKSGVEYDYDIVTRTTMDLIDTGVVHVAENKETGEIVGFILLLVEPFIFNPKYNHAVDYAFYVTPEYRKYGIGRTLLSTAETAAKQKGCKFITMVHMQAVDPTSAEKTFTELGYKKNETLFTKGI